MIIFDTPRATNYRRFRLTAHCGSTLIGAEGTRELLDFGHSIGLRESWLQHGGQPREHFDLFDRRIGGAKRAGATEVTGRDFVRLVVWPKRKWTALARRAQPTAQPPGEPDGH